MKRFAKTILTASLFLVSTAICWSQDEKIDISDQEKKVFNETQLDTVKIANAESQYEILIIEPGFYTWLSSVAWPEGYYSQQFLENRNNLFVMEWNRRVLQPNSYNSNLYLWQIEYDPNVDYGYDVNYKLYNYFIYIQRKYNQQLSLYQPRI